MYLKEIQAGEGARNSITVVIVLRIYLRERERDGDWLGLGSMIIRSYNGKSFVDDDYD